MSGVLGKYSETTQKQVGVVRHNQFGSENKRPGSESILKASVLFRQVENQADRGVFCVKRVAGHVHFQGNTHGHSAGERFGIP